MPRRAASARLAKTPQAKPWHTPKGVPRLGSAGLGKARLVSASDGTVCHASLAAALPMSYRGVFLGKGTWFMPNAGARGDSRTGGGRGVWRTGDVKATTCTSTGCLAAALFRVPPVSPGPVSCGGSPRSGAMASAVA